MDIPGGVEHSRWSVSALGSWCCFSPVQNQIQECPRVIFRLISIETVPNRLLTQLLILNPRKKVPGLYASDVNASTTNQRFCMRPKAHSTPSHHVHVLDCKVYGIRHKRPMPHTCTCRYYMFVNSVCFLELGTCTCLAQ